MALVNISLQGEELRARDDAFAGYQGVWRLIRGVLQRAGQFMTLSQLLLVLDYFNFDICTDHSQSPIAFSLSSPSTYRHHLLSLSPHATAVGTMGAIVARLDMPIQLVEAAINHLARFPIDL